MNGALAKLVVGLSASNMVMMSAWYLLLPVDLPMVVAIFPSWGMACIEYLFHVSANRATHEKLGLVRLRGANEVLNFLAFLCVCFITGQPLYWKYWIAACLVGMTAYLFLLSEGKHKGWLVLAVVLVIAWSLVALTWLRIPPALGKITGGPAVLPGGLPLWLFLGCFVANSFMLLAWYTHLHIEKPPVVFRKSAWTRWLFAWLLSCGIALLEYSVLIPVNRLSYRHVSMMALYGYMEITTVTVFLCGVLYLSSKYPHTQKLNRMHFVGFLLLILIESSTCIF